MIKSIGEREKSSTSALNQLCKPRILKLEENLYAAQCEVMKLIPAEYIIEPALSVGQLQPGGTVVESSSGTCRIGLAMGCAHYGLELDRVTGLLSKSLHGRLENLGVYFERIDVPTGAEGGIQQDRLNRLKEIMTDNENVFWTRQHTNPLNPESYIHSIGQQCLDEIGSVDVVICSTGTGGSITGIARKYRDVNKSLVVVAVDRILSVLFGPTTGRLSRLCTESYSSILGMGADVVSSNLDRTVCDWVHRVPLGAMVSAAHQIHGRYGLFVGPTGAATFLVADWVAKYFPGAGTLCVFPDHGVRDTDTMFNPQLVENYASQLDGEYRLPSAARSPVDVTGDGQHFEWKRRTYDDVMGFPPQPRMARQTR